MSGASLLPASGLELLLQSIGLTLVHLLAGTILLPLTGLVLLLPAGTIHLPAAGLVVFLLGCGADPFPPMFARLLLLGNGLGEHLILPGVGLDDTVHPLAGNAFLPAARLLLLLLGSVLDPALSLAGAILLPGADLVLVFICLGLPDLIL